MNELELNKIHCGDSYKLIKQIPDNSIDLIVTDPPYFFSNISGGNEVKIRQQRYLDYIKTNGKDNYSEVLRISLQKAKSRNELQSISNGINNNILDEMVRVMKKINIYIFCNKNQLKQYFNYFDKLGCNIDLLVWHKTNVIPNIKNIYMSDLEYIVYAREKGVPLYGDYSTKSKVYTSSVNQKDKKLFFHPTIKPLQLIKNLIINSFCVWGGSFRSFYREWYNCSCL